MRQLNTKMIRILTIIAIVALTGFNGLSQDRDGTMTIDDTLFVSNVFEYQDTIIPVTDIAYHEFSTDNATWTKDTTGANWVRFSNDVQNTFWVLPMSAFENYWEVSGDTLMVLNGYLTRVDSLYVSSYIDATTYKQGGGLLDVDGLDGAGGTEGQTLVNRSGKPVWEEFPVGVGETNVGSNVGTTGVDLYEGKDGVVLNFATIKEGDVIDITKTDSVATISFDGTQRSIATGVMISGGGNLSIDRTHNLDINGGVASSDVDPATDYIPVYDASLAAHRKVLVSDIVSSESLAYVDSIYTEPFGGFNAEEIKYTKDGVEYNIATILKQDGIQDGGLVTWQSGLIFDISPCWYIINSEGDSTSTETVTLSTADPTNPRIDVIAVDTSGSVVVIEGTPSASPQKPTVNPASQLELTFAIVEAGATVPTPPNSGVIVDTVVYNENVEWTASASGVVVDFNSSVSPYIGSICADVSTIESADYLKFVSATNVATNFTNLTFFVKAKFLFNKFDRLMISFYLDGVLVSNTIGKKMDISTTGWQNLTIPFGDFSFTGTEFNEVRMEWLQKQFYTTTGFYLDYMKLQSGITQPPSSGGIDLYTNDTIRENSISRLNIIESGIVDVAYSPSGNVTINATEVDGSITNEIQDISTDNTAGDISISDGSSITLNVDDADASTTNEIQDLWDVVTSNSGSTTANSPTDNLIVVGEQGLKTRISNDTLYVKQNETTQALTGVSDTLDLDVGLHGTHTMSGVDTIFIDNLFTNATGNITVTCQAADDSIRFLGGTVIISPTLSSVNGAIPVTNGASAKDVYSYWYDGTNIIINGTKNYD